MKPDLRIHLKFWDRSGITTFYFYYPHAPHHIPRMGDAARPCGFGEVFHPPKDKATFEKAKKWAREKWGCEIVKTSENETGWTFHNIPGVEGEFNKDLRELKESTRWPRSSHPAISPRGQK